MGQGRTLSGRYELVQLIARGGMAQVYEARDHALDRRVAVKALDPALATDEDAVSRFRREARQAAGLTHPHVVSVFDHGSHEGTHYIVMEHVGGGTLADLIEDEAPLDPARVVQIMAQVCEGLGAAHDIGIIHRDVKPANIMFDEHGRAKVADFGIARALTDVTITRTGTLLGSAAYLSPEQAAGKPIDTRADIYALGCVVYEMLTGKPPFHGGSPITIATHHLRTQPTPPLAIRDDLPSRLSAVVLEALAKDPDDRPPTARELWVRLEGALPEAARTETLALVGSGAADETVAIAGTGLGRDTASFDRAAFDDPPSAVAAPPSSPASTPPRPHTGEMTSGPAEHPSSRRDRGDRSSVFGAVAVLVGVLVAAFALVGLLTGDDAPSSATGSNPSEADALAPVVAAGDAMKAALDAAVADGWLPDDSASAFHRGTNRAVETFVAGDTAAAMGYLGELRAGIEALSREEVISGQQALDLLEPLAELEEQMRALRPVEIEEILDEDAPDEPPAQPTDDGGEDEDDDGEGDDGKGEGNDKGKGKGNGKGKDD
ncbi:MAG: protein kinase [Actinobacteria bacterium]|nr:protein kinase [Actinomycetota bacterium]